MASANYANLIWSMVSSHLKASHSSSVWSDFLSSGRALIFLVVILCALGLFFVFEASVAEAFALVGDHYFFLKRQALHMLLGFGALIVSYFMPSIVWKKLSPLAYGVSLLGLLMVFIPGLGLEINGAHRWVFVGGFNFQPIEVVKLSITIFFASWLSQHQRLLPFIFLTLIPAGLVMLQPDLGSTLVLLSIAASLYFVAGGQIKPFLAAGGIGVLLLSLLILLSPYRRQRLETFMNPESDPLGASFHIRQITLALGNGGILGQGIGNSRQKYSYIPEASTDSIFAIVAEEVGFVGSAVIFLLFGLFIYTGFQVIKRSPADRYEKLVAVGVLAWLSSQTILNLSAVVALVPLTGVPLPFFSYGGTSLIMILFATGLLLHITRKNNT